MKRSRVVLVTLAAMAWLPSCNREIVHEYTFDPAPLATLTTPLAIDLWQLPGPTKALAKDGVNMSSGGPQPEGIIDWIRLDVPAHAASRTVTADVRIFDTVPDAQRHIEWELEFARPSRPEKYRRGVLPNGVEYVASYIVQHRGDPEGCNAPMEVYGSFLIFRHRKHVVTVRVLENRPRGVIPSDTAYVARLLNRSGASAP